MSLSTSASSRRRNLSCKAWIRKRLVSTPRSAVINNSSRSSRSSASTTLRPRKSRSRPPLRASRVRLNRSRRRRNTPRRTASSGTSPVSSRSSASGRTGAASSARLPAGLRLPQARGRRGWPAPVPAPGGGVGGGRAGSRQRPGFGPSPLRGGAASSGCDSRRQRRKSRGVVRDRCRSRLRGAPPPGRGSGLADSSPRRPARPRRPRGSVQSPPPGELPRFPPSRRYPCPCGETSGASLRRRNFGEIGHVQKSLADTEQQGQPVAAQSGHPRPSPAPFQKRRPPDL